MEEEPVWTVDAGELLDLLEASDYPFKGLSPEAIEGVPLDVVRGIAPSESAINYGPVELEYRRSIEEWYATHPDAGLDIPFDAAPAEMRIPEDE